jgi:hypothetical protein
LDATSQPGEQKTDEELDHAIRQIISKAMVSVHGGNLTQRAEVAVLLLVVLDDDGICPGLPIHIQIIS